MPLLARESLFIPPSSIGSDNLCPWGQRREKSGILYSFVVTLFTSLTIHGHLMHSILGRRDIYQIAFHLYWIYLFPWTPAAMAVCGGLAAMILAILNVPVSWEQSKHYASRITSTKSMITSRDKRVLLYAFLDPCQTLILSLEALGKPIRISCKAHTVLSPISLTGKYILFLFAAIQVCGTLVRGYARLEAFGILLFVDIRTFLYALASLAPLIKTFICEVHGISFEMEHTDLTILYDRLFLLMGIFGEMFSDTEGAGLNSLTMKKSIPAAPSFKSNLISIPDMATATAGMCVSGWCLCVLLNLAERNNSTYVSIRPFLKNKALQGLAVVVSLAFAVWEIYNLVFIYPFAIVGTTYDAFQLSGEPWPTSVACPQLAPDPFFVPAL